MDPSNPQATQLVQLLIPMVVVPMLTWGVKWALPKIPTFLLPILAPVLGLSVDFGLSYLTNSGNPLYGAIAGSAGVGLREIVDQVRRAAAEGVRPADSTPPPGTIVPPRG